MAEPTTDAPAPDAPEAPATPPPKTLAVQPLPAEDEAKLDMWKANARKNENTAKTALAELEKLRTASMSEQEKAVAEAFGKGKAEAASAIQLERVRDKIEAKAGGKLADPEDAAALLGDLSRFVQDDGTIDTSGIGQAVDNLVKSKPYLSVQPGNGSGEGGPRGQGSRTTPTQDPLLDAVQRAVGGNSR